VNPVASAGPTRRGGIVGAVDHLPDDVARGAETVTTSSGRDAIRLSLGYTGRISGETIGERREELTRILSDAVDGLPLHADADIDWDHLSVSGQTLQVLVPLDEVADVEDAAVARGLRVDAVRRDQVL